MSQRLYVAIIADRHADPEPYVFTDEQAAIDFARSQAVEYSHDGEIEEREIKGWSYYASYSPESDCVWVVAKNLDEHP